MLLSIMENEFKYTSGQYAKILGITKEALRSRRRRGELETEYIIQNGITLWKEPASNYGRKPGGQISSSHAARSRVKRRGVHAAGIKTNYPNYAMQRHNELKMLAKLQRNVDPELQDLLPEAIEQAKRIKAQKQHQLQRELINQRPKSYGRMYNPKFATPTWDEFKEKPKPKKYNYY